MDQREEFVSATCKGERCFCGQPAVRKVGEEIAFDDPRPRGHNLTSYICAEHFAQIMGPAGARDVGFVAGWEKRSPAGDGAGVAEALKEEFDRELAQLREMLAHGDLSDYGKAKLQGLELLERRAVDAALAARSSPPSPGVEGERG